MKTLFSILFVGFSFIWCQGQSIGSTWQEALAQKKAKLQVHWFESKPFVYNNRSEQLEGIEVELIKGFRQYVKDNYQVELTLEWRQAGSFIEAYETIKSAEVACLGASAFSMTPEREAEVAFVAPYISDISVLISSQNVPVTDSAEDFAKSIKGKTAVTIRGTTYEQDLIRLRDNHSFDFNIEYIPSHLNILREVQGREDSFGFIDLPIYMMMFSEDPSLRVKRQNQFTVKRKGYALIMPLNSDWKQPFDEYYQSIEPNIESMIGRYLDLEIYHLMESLAKESNEKVELLTKEKEIQHQELVSKAGQLQASIRNNNYLIATITVTFLSLIAIIALYRTQSDQKKEIEDQQKNIEASNEQLKKRNDHLVALNDEKNNLIKVLAHDLRTPINHVQGLAQVLSLSNPGLPDDQKNLIQNITDASLRLNRMISNILDVDAIENNRVALFCERTDVSALLAKVVQSFDKAAARKSITLHVSGTEVPVFAVIDSLFFTQILENLISNALKFSDRGKSVRIRLIKGSENHQVAVIDEGPGLSEEDQHLLFRKFQRLSPRPTDGEMSTGLGLAIVKRFIELMHGRVWCQSTIGQGSQFCIEFPAA